MVGRAIIAVGRLLPYPGYSGQESGKRDFVGEGAPQKNQLTTTPTLSATFPYSPHSAGPLSFSGEVQVSFPSEGVVDLVYHLENVQTECREPQPDTPNSCGIHIHEGKTCEDASLVGGHFYQGNSDPWGYVVYTTEAKGEAFGEAIVSFGNPDTP